MKRVSDVLRGASTGVPHLQMTVGVLSIDRTITCISEKVGDYFVTVTPTAGRQALGRYRMPGKW